MPRTPAYELAERSRQVLVALVSAVRENNGKPVDAGAVRDVFAPGTDSRGTAQTLRRLAEAGFAARSDKGWKQTRRGTTAAQRA